MSTGDPSLDLLGAVITRAIQDARKKGKTAREAREWLSSFLDGYGEPVQSSWPPGAWTVDQLAKAVGAAHSTISIRCQKGEIESVRVGRSYAIPDRVARRFIDDQKWPPGAWTVDQLAQAVGLHVSRITARIQVGEIRAVRLIRSYAIPKEAALQFVRSRAA